jgi:hypothetical protein
MMLMLNAGFTVIAAHPFKERRELVSSSGTCVGVAADMDAVGRTGAETSGDPVIVDRAEFACNHAQCVFPKFESYLHPRKQRLSGLIGWRRGLRSECPATVRSALVFLVGI